MPFVEVFSPPGSPRPEQRQKKLVNAGPRWEEARR